LCSSCCYKFEISLGHIRIFGKGFPELAGVNVYITASVGIFIGCIGYTCVSEMCIEVAKVLAKLMRVEF
jgi:hypothetical protein